MPGYLTYECRKCEHQFEKVSSEDFADCPKCGDLCDILWVSPRSPHAQLKVPIVMWRYADGTLGVAGGADSRTPANAERVEVRSASDYRRLANTLNSQLRSKDERREEVFQKGMEAMDKYHRSNLIHLMGQENDPVAKDIYREALSKDRRAIRPSFQEFYSIAMEKDRSNYEG